VTLLEKLLYSLEPNLPIFCFAANACFMQIDLILDEAPQLENQRPFECGGS
jgi:hypothetical protein